MSAIPTTFMSAATASRRGVTSTLHLSWRRSIAIPSSLSCAQHARQKYNKGFSTATYPILKAPVTAVKSLQFRQHQGSRGYSTQGSVVKSVGFEDVNAKITASPSNIILVDVREPAELSSTGIIPGAVSVPLASQPDAYFLSPDEFETRFGYPKPGFETAASGAAAQHLKETGEREIIFYCKAGVRADAAAQLAVRAGYDPQILRVYHGSWLDWTKNGGKVERWEGNE